ncbi:MAG: 16S rRNA (cytidine(1402)-2'-O)-methyltransferase [Erysipelotrichales bacterium]|nr:16S rRNA (cytidine(1402)-2'-O)-methyltransferase [Erysipelotrichales bacterium]
MTRQKSFLNETRTLYLVATPIGNISDITIRALELLKSVDIIYCEDKRNSLKLLTHYNIKVPLKSYHEFNKEKASKTIIEDFNKYQKIALISDAGTPVISDPGYELVKILIEKEFNIVSIPGASAFLSALIVSGLETKPFIYYGFLSEKETKRKSELENLRYQKMTLIFYEAPHRLKKTLTAILEVLGNRQIVIARELTKKFEEIIRGTANELLMIEEDLKGEIVLVVEGNKDLPDFSAITIEEHVKSFIKDGLTKNEAIKKVAQERNIPKNEVYKKCLNKDN